MMMKLSGVAHYTNVQHYIDGIISVLQSQIVLSLRLGFMHKMSNRYYRKRFFSQK